MALRDKLNYGTVLLFFLTIFQFPCFISLLITCPLKKLFGYKTPMKFSRELFHLGLKLTNKYFFKITFLKKPSIKKRERYVYMANHSSYADPIITATLSQMPVSISIQYAKYVPFLGFNMWLMNIPFVKNVKPHEKSIPKGITTMYSNFLNHPDNIDMVFTVFPTGKRIFVKDDIHLTDLKSGGFVIAKNINCDIVPVYHNIIDVFNDTTKSFNLNKRVYCLMGKPIKTKDKSIDELKQLYYDALIKLRDQMEQLQHNSK